MMLLYNETICHQASGEYRVKLWQKHRGELRFSPKHIKKSLLLPGGIFTFERGLIFMWFLKVKQLIYPCKESVFL